MTAKDAVFEIDQKNYELKCSTNSVLAVHTAMQSEWTTPDSFVDALFSVILSLEAVQKGIDQVIKQCLEDARKVECEFWSDPGGGTGRGAMVCGGGRV